MKIKTTVDDRGFFSYSSDSDYPLVTFEGTISASNYLGIPIGSGSNVAVYDAVRTFHEPTITAGRASVQPGQGPTFSVAGALMMLSFTVDDNSDKVYRLFKIPTSYITGSSFHVHWSKTGDTNENGKNVRWRIGYNVYNGSSQDAALTTTFTEIEDIYEDSGTTNRIVYRTPNIPLSNFVAGYYVSVYIQSIAPLNGVAMSSEPGLVSLDLMYTASINH